MNVGIIGCGAIGTTLARYMEEEPGIQTIHITDRTETCVMKLASSLTKARASEDFEAMLVEVDLVIEAAGREAVFEYGVRILEAGRDLVILSGGALLDNELHQNLEQAAAKGNSRYHIPSGAVAGLDGIKGAMAGIIGSVRLTTRKPPLSFEGVEYVEKELGLKKADLMAIKEEKIIFEGLAKDAVVAFPANINVAATVALAGLGPDKTLVRIIADPEVSTNRHLVEVIGDFGMLEVRVTNVPSLRNPKTSHLAALSALATVKSLLGRQRVGT